jgi:hypothetical protein
MQNTKYLFLNTVTFYVIPFIIVTCKMCIYMPGFIPHYLIELRLCNVLLEVPENVQTRIIFPALQLPNDASLPLCDEMKQ